MYCALHFPQTNLLCVKTLHFRNISDMMINWQVIIIQFLFVLLFSGSSDEDENENLVEDETNILCCQGGRKLLPNSLHPECFPIEIPSNDIFFSRFNQKCMEFVRSMPAERPDCSLGPREQVCISHEFCQLI